MEIKHNILEKVYKEVDEEEDGKHEEEEEEGYIYLMYMNVINNKSIKETLVRVGCSEYPDISYREFSNPFLDFDFCQDCFPVSNMFKSLEKVYKTLDLIKDYILVPDDFGISHNYLKGWYNIRSKSKEELRDVIKKILFKE